MLDVITGKTFANYSEYLAKEECKKLEGCLATVITYVDKEVPMNYLFYNNLGIPAKLLNLYDKIMQNSSAGKK
jgi:hypothetical protein